MNEWKKTISHSPMHENNFVNITDARRERKREREGEKWEKTVQQCVLHMFYA